MARPAMAANSPDAPALEKRPEKGIELLPSIYPFTHRNKKKKRRKREDISPNLKSKLTGDVPDVLHDLMLIAIGFGGLQVGLFKAPKVQFNL